jgi:hypothetical protein
VQTYISVAIAVEHQIHLKPDAVSKHQRPYKLPPHKRDVLRHQLDVLLSQGRIAPVNEKEQFGICRVNDPVNSSTFGIVYRKACVLEFRYRKSMQFLNTKDHINCHLTRGTYCVINLMNC